MANELPLVILDEIMLPGADTEVALDPDEAAQLAASWGDDGGGAPVLVACRVPGTPAPTRMEQRASGSPGELVAAAILGEGRVLPATAEEPAPRLAVDAPTRARLGEVQRGEHGWTAGFEPWPLDTAGVEGDEVRGLTARFLRVLLATRPPEEVTSREAVDRPVMELQAARTVASRLLLLADYLFERADVRLQVLTAESGAEVRDVVADALELIEQGIPKGAGVVRAPLKAYLRAASEGPLADMRAAAAVLRSLAPLTEPGEAAVKEAEALADELASLAGRFERLAVKLTKRRK